MSDRVKELEELIKYHSDLYYNGQAEITDAEYDLLIEELRELDYKNPLLFRVGYSPRGYGKVVQHSVPMGSLDKVPDIKKIIGWAIWNSGGTGEIVVMPKIDGCALRLKYEDGRLVEAATRGDGKMGMDVTDNVYQIKSIPKIIDNFSGEVLGEIYIKRSDFDKLLQEGLNFKNSRNAASGSIMSKDPQEVGKRRLSFLAYGLRFKSGKKFVSEINLLKALGGLGFEYVNADSINVKILNSVIKGWEESRKDLDYEIDGLVISINDLERQEKAGFNGLNPIGKIAYKFLPEIGKAKVLGIDWQVGRTGRLTPMARIEPTLLAGSTISNITLHNSARLRGLRLEVGDMVSICKAGDIIPAVLKNLSYEENKPMAVMPSYCPVCNSPTSFDKNRINLWCHNLTCSAKVERHILHYIRTLDIKGVGEGIISEMCRLGYLNSVKDLYYLTFDQYQKVTGGVRAAEKAMNAILSKNEIPLAVFLDSLGIDGLGTTTSSDIAKRFKSLGVIMDSVKAGGWENELIKLEGIRELTAGKIVGGLKSLQSLIEDLTKVIDVIDVKESNGRLNGLSFVLTGAMSRQRKDIVADIEQNGGEVKSSVGRRVDYLVQSDANSTSTKTQKAKSLGVKIISEEELMAMMV